MSKILTLIMFLLLSLGSYAETVEVEMEEEPKKESPIRKSFIPKPRVYVIDKVIVNIEVPFLETPTTLIVTDAGDRVIYNQTIFGSHYLPHPLTVGEVYGFSVYVNNTCYTGTYYP